MGNKIKEIFCIAHSHLDVGYTHPQPMLLELQCDYIDNALELCRQTEDRNDDLRFRWTCEASYPLFKWFETASLAKIELFRHMVQNGQMSVTALPMHTTPGCTAVEMANALQSLDTLRDLTGSKITTAISHDVNGQPWALADMMLDSNVQFYMTGINIHMGGIPFPRPYAFLWECQDGRSIPTFLGEHYSLFSQLLFTRENETSKMHEGIQEYTARLEKTDWLYDFAMLTATNPPLYDNNCPDMNLPDLVKRYNEEGHEIKVRFVTPEQLYERLCERELTNWDVQRGDWNDFWNFGCGSTARETKIAKQAKHILSKADFLECLGQFSTDRYKEVHTKAYEAALLFDEHTWGSGHSVTDFDQEQTYAQLNHKKEYAYTCADLAAYALSVQMEQLAQNPVQSDKNDGIIVVNPAAFDVKYDVFVPKKALVPGRTMAAVRAKEYMPYAENNPDTAYAGTVSMPAFSAKKIPFSALQKAEMGSVAIYENYVETPFYTIYLDSSVNKIIQIKSRKNGHLLLNDDNKFDFFGIVEERVDEKAAPQERRTIFPRDIDLGNKSISQWNTEWPAKYTCSKIISGQITETDTAVVFTYQLDAFDLQNAVQTISFYKHNPRIGLDVTFTNPVKTEPHAIYFTFPLKLNKNWKAVYDTADTFVKFEDDMLGSVCRDWVTTDKTVSLYDDNKGVTLACPDAPLVQIGAFNFGRENKEIKRNDNPLLLAWPMNNYWDTNFSAEQQGKQRFHYQLSCFEKFDEKTAYKEGLLAKDACTAGAQINCDVAQATQFLICENKNVFPTFFMPLREKDGFIAAMKNFSKAPEVCRIVFPHHKLVCAERTDLQGNTIQSLKAEGSSVAFTSPALSTTYLRICIAGASAI